MPAPARWPGTAAELVAVQEELGRERPEPWRAPADPLVGGCFACPPRGVAGRGAAGDPLWAGAASYRGRRCTGRATVTGVAGAAYTPGLLALRVGPVLAAAVRALPEPPDVVIVDATGLDHPRRAGLARHLGAVLDLPTVGVTHRTLVAGRGWRVGGGDSTDWPAGQERGATGPLLVDGELVGYWLCTRAGRRPVAVHAGWRTSPATAVAVVLAVAGHRTPAPLREARRLARTARATAGG